VLISYCFTYLNVNFPSSFFLFSFFLFFFFFYKDGQKNKSQTIILPLYVAICLAFTRCIEFGDFFFFFFDLFGS
jgi:hypothetical protein